MNVTTTWEQEIADSAITWPNIGGRGADKGDTVYRLDEIEIDGELDERGRDWYGGIVVSKRDNSIRLYIGHETMCDPGWAGTVNFETVSEAIECLEATVADIEGNN